MIDYKADPKFWQRFLACAGFYKDTIDGDFGTNSQKALHEFEQASIDLGNSAAGSFDGRSEGNIQTLLPAAQRKAREFMKAVRDAGITIKIISGTRTFAEQHALFTQVPHVTKADAGHSNHNFGVAWDIGDFTGGTYHPESEVYKKVGEIGKKNGKSAKHSIKSFSLKVARSNPPKPPTWAAVDCLIGDTRVHQLKQDNFDNQQPTNTNHVYNYH